MPTALSFHAIFGILRGIEIGFFKSSSSSAVVTGCRFRLVPHFAGTSADNVHNVLEKLNVSHCVPVVSDSSIGIH